MIMLLIGYLCRTNLTNHHVFNVLALSYTNPQRRADIAYSGLYLFRHARESLNPLVPTCPPKFVLLVFIGASSNA